MCPTPCPPTVDRGAARVRPDAALSAGVGPAADRRVGRVGDPRVAATAVDPERRGAAPAARRAALEPAVVPQEPRQGRVGPRSSTAAASARAAPAPALSPRFRDADIAPLRRESDGVSEAGASPFVIHEGSVLPRPRPPGPGDAWSGAAASSPPPPASPRTARRALKPPPASRTAAARA